jgi:hypothetical protein
MVDIVMTPVRNTVCDTPVVARDDKGIYSVLMCAHLPFLRAVIAESFLTCVDPCPHALTLRTITDKAPAVTTFGNFTGK